MINNISTEILQEWLRLGEAILIDVRELVEYNSGTIAGALHIPLSEVIARLPLVETNGKKIVFFCAAGVRSAYACQILKNDGYDDELYNFQPGYSGWLAAHEPQKSAISN